MEVLPAADEGDVGEKATGSVQPVLSGEAGGLLQTLLELLPLLPHNISDAGGSMNGRK